jgi:hypothetical protein
MAALSCLPKLAVSLPVDCLAAAIKQANAISIKLTAITVDDRLISS